LDGIDLLAADQGLPPTVRTVLETLG
jgi:hypothetical protein